MSPLNIRLFEGMTLIVIMMLLASHIQPAAACEIAFPPNFRYEEHYTFDDSRFPPGLTVNTVRPAWVEDEGLVGYLQLVNGGTADVYLLFTFELGNLAGTLIDGQQIDSTVWSRGLPLKPGDTFDIIGEGNMMQFSPGLKPVNVNNIEGQPLPPSPHPSPTQSGQLYLVMNQKLSIVPFTIAYRDNPVYQPEGSFHPLTMAQKVENAPLIALGEAVQEAGYDSRPTTKVRIEQWLKGSGPGEITVSGFGNTSCDYQIEAGARRVFFLAPEGEGYRLNGFQAGMFDALVRPEEADDILAIIGPVEPVPSSDLNRTRTALPWLYSGPLLVVVLISSMYFWRRYRDSYRA